MVAATLALPWLGALTLPATTSECAYVGFRALFLLSGLQEARASTATPYSKFAHGKSVTTVSVSSRFGMFVIYAPAAALSLYLRNAASPTEPLSDRAILVNGLIFLHFAKRVGEVLFVHVYSGSMDLGKATAIISTAYIVDTFMTNQFVGQLSVPNPNLVVPGVAMFVLGQGVNAYHHYLLSRLRTGAVAEGEGETKGGAEGSSKYKTPRGGLFESTTCPHFAGEVVAWFGIALLSQHVGTWLLAAGMTSYLAGRAYSTTQWYRTKLEDYPPGRAHMFPGLW